MPTPFDLCLCLWQAERIRYFCQNEAGFACALKRPIF